MSGSTHAGLGILTYVTTLPPVRRSSNWCPSGRRRTFSTLDGSLFLLGLLGLAAVLALSPRRPTAFQLVSFLGFGCWACVPRGVRSGSASRWRRFWRTHAAALAA